MRCPEVRSLIKNYHEGTLEEYTQIKIHHHLVRCKECTEDYAMWTRGEDFMKKKSSNVPAYSPSLQSSSSTTSAVMDNVMGRIQNEEKWAHPTVKRNKTYSNRTKVMLSFVSSMMLIFFILFFATRLTPQTEDVSDHVITLEMMDEWKIDKIVLDDPQKDGETSMHFQVVAGLSDPIVYTLAEDKKEPKYGIILSIFGILSVIVGMSWITRV